MRGDGLNALAGDILMREQRDGLAMNSVQRSILFSAVERYGSLVLFLVATAVLSRLLTPAEFGIYAVVNAVTAVIAASFQEFGGANYLIQKRELSRSRCAHSFHHHARHLGSHRACFCSLLRARSQICSSRTVCKRGIEVSALNFLLVPFSGTISALFRRDMEFGTLADLQSCASGVAVALVSIGLAMMGFSYMAPIWGGVAGNVVLDPGCCSLASGFRRVASLARSNTATSSASAFIPAASASSMSSTTLRPSCSLQEFSTLRPSVCTAVRST